MEALYQLSYSPEVALHDSRPVPIFCSLGAKHTFAFYARRVTSTSGKHLAVTTMTSHGRGVRHPGSGAEVAGPPGVPGPPPGGPRTPPPPPPFALPRSVPP